MAPNLRQEVISEIHRIASQILAKANWDAELVWKTVTIENPREELSNYSWQYAENIYSGNGGIALFLLEAGKCLEVEEYTAAAHESMKKLCAYSLKTSSNNFAFITGRMSVVFAALQFAKASNDTEYRTIALELAKDCSPWLYSANPDDYINGTAGTLIGLLHLHAATNSPSILRSINKCLVHLLERAKFWRQGLFWDKLTDQIHGLCGFSHGASGVGFAFLEAGKYFNNTAFVYIAEQAFLYESQHFNKEENNWYDWRKGIYSKASQVENETHYRKNDLVFFQGGWLMNAWCHGAAGIGLSRLHAYDLLKADSYLVEAESAITCTVHTDTAISPDKISSLTYSLCHGGGGNADVFIEAYRLFKDEKYLGYTEAIIRQSLQQYKENGSYRSGFGTLDISLEDISLFMGIAGIGHFYLRALFPTSVSSILAPKLSETFNGQEYETTEFPMIYVTPAEIRRTILGKLFPRTLVLLNFVAPKELQNYLETLKHNRINEEQEFLEFSARLLAILPSSSQTRIKDCIALENTKNTLNNAIESTVYLHIKNQVESKFASETNNLSDDEFNNLTLVIDNNVQLFSTKWRWTGNNRTEWEENLVNDSTEIFVLLKVMAMEVIEEELSLLGATICKTFYAPLTVIQGIDSIIKICEYTSEDEYKYIRAAITLQIRKLLLLNVLYLVQRS